MRNQLNLKLIFCLGFILGCNLWCGTRVSHADIIVNILAVNGTEGEKEKEINELLPRELKFEDILDAAGLEIKYDVDSGGYRAVGNVTLGPKESRTLRVRVRDVWKIDPQEIDAVKEQIKINHERLKDTEYFEAAEIKRNSLVQRLDFILAEQKKSQDDTGRRIDRYRTYETELNEIRNNAVSVKYWRSKPPTVEEANIFRLILEAENPSDFKSITKEQIHYLPKEVKPEHILDASGFDVRYDAIKGQSYLSREEELEPGEKKRYEIGLIDIWNIDQQKIENLRDRTRTTFKLLENSKYVDSAGFLVAGIKKHLDAIDLAQSQQTDITQHISDFRFNVIRFDRATKDVKALEELLDAVREKLVRSRLENVLEKIRGLKGIGDIAKAVLDNKAFKDGSGKGILWVIVAVGVLTFGSFIYWLTRSKEVVIKDSEESEDSQEKQEAGVG